MPEPNATACASCRSLNLQCIVNKDGDRRKAGSRQHVAALQERLDYLESYIARGQHKVDQGNGGSTSPATGLSHNAGPELSPAPSRAQRPSFDDSNGASNTSTPHQKAFVIPQDSEPSPPPPLPPISNTQFRPPSLLHMESSGHRSETGRLTPSSDSDPSRLDLDEADGQPRLYGPTSQPYIQRHAVPVDTGDTVSHDESLSIDSAPLRASLFHTYWKIQPHSIIIVGEAFFVQGRDAGRRSEYYSSFLEDAILACATRLSTSDGVRALGSRYVERAKAVIAHELERPNTATLQGFLLLSDFEATRGRDRLGYLYSGKSPLAYPN